jgi:alpha-ribazole phosphatase
LKLTLIRHTSLQVPAGVCYGQSDVDVSAHFMQEVAQLKEKLALHQQASRIDAVYASPLQRCSKLALALGLDLGLQPIQHDDRLKELHFGDWEMQAWDDLPREYFDEWAQNYAHMAPPNGETFSQLQARGVDFLNHALQAHPQQHVVAVTHGGMIRALVAHVLNMPLKGLFRFEIDYASITQLDFHGLKSGGVPKIVFVNR